MMTGDKPVEIRNAGTTTMTISYHCETVSVAGWENSRHGRGFLFWRFSHELKYMSLS